MKHLLASRRLLPFLLTLTLLASCFIAPASAYDLYPDYSDHSGYDFTDWRYDAATGTLTAEYPAREYQHATTLTYTAHAMEGSSVWSRLYIERRVSVYKYELDLKIGLTTYSFESPAFASDVVFMTDSGSEEQIPFFTKEAAADLTVLLNGTTANGHLLRVPRNQSSYRAITSDRFSGTWESLFFELDRSRTSPDTLTLPLRDLRFVSPATIYALGETTWFSVPTHFIYELEGTHYVLPADTLTDAQFQNGTLNTALSDIVTLYPLTEDALSDYEKLTDHVESDIPTYTHESDEARPTGGNSDDSNISSDVNLDESARKLAYVAVVFCGILVPIAPVATGLAKGLAGKKSNTRRWLWLAYAGGAWMLCGVVMLVLLLV